MERIIGSRRPLAALALSCALCTAAHGQPAAGPPADPDARHRVEPAPATEADLAVRADRSRPPAGSMVTLPGANEISVGIGRFSVIEPPRARTHMEVDRAPTNVRRRERGIGGLGLRITF